MFATRSRCSAKHGMAQRLVVDASHANSGKDHVRQAEVVREVAARIADGGSGYRRD